MYTLALVRAQLSFHAADGDGFIGYWSNLVGIPAAGVLDSVSRRNSRPGPARLGYAAPFPTPGSGCSSSCCIPTRLDRCTLIWGPTSGDRTVMLPWEIPMESPPDCAVALVPYYTANTGQYTQMLTSAAKEDAIAGQLHGAIATQVAYGSRSGVHDL